MSISDPIADMLTILRNANRIRQDQTMIKRSKLSLAILKVLKDERFIYDFKTIEDNNQGLIRVYLKSPEGIDRRPLRKITKIERISKPGLRIYAGCRDIPRVLSGIGVSVLSTSKGVMSGRQARKSKLGGEVMVKIW